MNCTATNVEDTTFWAADLGSDSKSVQFRAGDKVFNDHGLYELPQTGMPPTLTLLINDTERNNQTEIFCNRDGMELFTTLFIFGKPCWVGMTIDHKSCPTRRLYISDLFLQTWIHLF